MAIVGVAGGTGHLGRTIVDAILATGKHEVKILTRKANHELEKEVGASIIAVDYSDVPALTKSLETNNIHTVISTLQMLGDTPEKNLIRAADASKTTKRMVSSDWGMPMKEEQRHMFGSVGPKLDAAAVLRATTDLEHTVVLDGFFLDYFGGEAISSRMAPVVAVLDIAHDAAAIPGSGDVPVTFTHTTDVARYVAALLDADGWDPISYVVGDTLSFNEFLQLAEEAKGTKFTVAYDSVEKLRAGQVTELPGHVASYSTFPKEAMQSMFAVFGLWFEEGNFNLPPPGARTLNERFPDIKPLTAREILAKGWKKA